MPDDRIASRARAAAASFECKKDGLRQTQAGEWKLTLTVLDLPPWLMTAHMGVRLMAALVELADDESPVDHGEDDSPEEPTPAMVAGAKLHRDMVSGKSEAARERFKLLGEPEQMVTRCALTCKDTRFWEFAGVHNEAEARAYVCSKLNIGRRRDLVSNVPAQRRWKSMLTDFDIFTGALPEQR